MNATLVLFMSVFPWKEILPIEANSIDKLIDKKIAEAHHIFVMATHEKPSQPMSDGS